MNRLVEKSSSNNGSRIKIVETTQQGNATNAGNNIILLRGAQSDGGHIILQNGQELLQLLNGETKSGTTATGKTIILQSPRIKQATESSRNVKNRILLHQTGATTLSVDQSSIEQAEGTSNLSSMDNAETIMLQTNGLSGKRISATTLSDGSILLHPRMVDSYTTNTATTPGSMSLSTAAGQANGDGPILLQTLKRFDKSIFVLRNSSQAVSGANVSGQSNKMTSSIVGNLQSKMAEEAASAAATSGTVRFVRSSASDNESVTKKAASAGRSGSGGGGSGANKANVFSKANNVNNSSSGGGGNVRSNGISTRSSTGQQKQQRGANRSDSENNKKDSMGSKSNIPLGSGELKYLFI